MIPIDYTKRNNTKLFRRFAHCDDLSVENAMNYNPIHQQFFGLNEHNFNVVNLKQKWFLSDIYLSEEEQEQEKDELITILDCALQNLDNPKKTKDLKVFFKIAPLINPFQYLLGRYDLSSNYVFPLPSLDFNPKSTNQQTDIITQKVNSANNVAYVDGFFCFLSNYVFQTFDFVNALEYYGSFIGMKNQYKFNVCDDICVLMESEHFLRNKDVLFSMKAEDFDKYHFDPQFISENLNVIPISIGQSLSLKSICSIDNMNEKEVQKETEEIEFDDLKEISVGLDEKENLNDSAMMLYENDDDSCSSRTSDTSQSSRDESSLDSSSQKADDDEDEEEEEEGDEEEEIVITIPSFPVNVICMEACFETFDSLICEYDLSVEEWYSSLFQIIMILIVFQRVFDFTHNDLHTNNIMYNETSKTHLFYKLDGIVYKVPTFGRIFKIIDFGRSIYHVNGKRFCSDSFEKLGDADTQYNSEPYFNPKKERIEPNYSFDLCRLACSIFDYLVEDVNEVNEYKECTNITSMDYVKKIIVEWCSDDKGRNVLYKSNGSDRYPGFKLYKMIARDVHHCVPKSEILREPFQMFMYKKNIPPSSVMDIDQMPNYKNN
jgi:hypothetical protein